MRRAAVYALVFVGGVAAGVLFEEPEARVEYRERVVYRDREVKAEARETLVTRVERPTVRILTRTVRVPGGATTTEVDRTETGGVDTSEATAEVRIEYRDREVERFVEKFRAAPRFYLGAGAGVSIADPSKVEAAVSASVRLWGDLHLRVTAAAPPADPREARVVATLEVPW